MVSSTKAVHSIREWRVRTAMAAILAWMIVFQSSAWAQQNLPLIRRLDPPTRAKALAALAALVILGFAMVALTWLGARVARRYMKGSSYLRPTSRPEKSDWSPQPLKPGDKLAEEPDDEGGS